MSGEVDVGHHEGHFEGKAGDDAETVDMCAVVERGAVLMILPVSVAGRAGIFVTVIAGRLGRVGRRRCGGLVMHLAVSQGASGGLHGRERH